MIKNITLDNFRKYKHLELSIPKNLVIITGKNAIGKTTILESIFLVSTSKSHRTSDPKEMIKDGLPFSKVNISTDEKNYTFIISHDGKKAAINNIIQSKISDFVGDLKCVMFSPSDSEIIVSEKSKRRRTFDLYLSLLNKNYIKHLNTFKTLLKQRNTILQAKTIDYTLLDVVTKQMTDYETKIRDYKTMFIKELNNYLNLLDNKIGQKEHINISYEPSIKSDFLEFYNNHLNQDVLYKRTNYGIHKDDYIFYLNDKEAKSYASLGQQRTIAIALKIALFYMIKDKTNSKPILLLDDLFSSLDKTRQENLVKYLISESQTFITTVDLDGIPKDLKDKAYIINLKGD